MKKVALILLILVTLTSCNSKMNLTAINLTDDVKSSDTKAISISELKKDGGDMTEQVTDFSLDIFKKIDRNDNTMISPLSIISCLAMTANGAKGETLSQMEDVFGTDIDKLNEYLKTYKNNLVTSEKYKVSLANSIWIKDKNNFEVKKDFLQKNRDYYNSEVYKALFDESTKKDINTWVKEKTDGQIEKLIEKKIPENAVMYLINAISFDAKWNKIYEENDIEEGAFITENNEIQKVDFMNSYENIYFELSNAIGFAKPYADNKYSFVALLPNEDVSLDEFIATLDGEILMNIFKQQNGDTKFRVSIPKFEFAYNIELQKVLKEMGISDAFSDELADFSGLRHSDTDNISISKVIHKSKVIVDADGSKAGAVTAVDMKDGCMIGKKREVILNKPFFFMIVDNEFNLPIFMGILKSVQQ